MDPGEFCDGIRILEEDSLQMVTWVSENYLDGYLNSLSNKKPFSVNGFDMWLSAVPDLKEFCKNQKFKDSTALDLRLEQLQGLPSSSNNDYFVELKVSKEDLYRPSHDSSILSARYFPDDSIRGSAKYTNWYKKKLQSSYSQENKFPWTRQGYTYDWGNPYSEIGLSEFVIPGSINSAKVLVTGIYTTEQYCLTKH